ncbi:MAG TPA: uracil-DNA glycosylase [Usitatibacter sp.]|jgi:DNA polymerase|nr:uracil-DNA glycosylase [Usitatibacter sp.]
MDERTLRELELANVAKLYGWAERAVAQVTAAAAEAASTATIAFRDVSALGWDELEQAVRDCRQCGLCRQRKQAVFGVGARSGPWMFVGEGPGADEDELGEPFVGQAGKLLDSMLAAAGLKRGRDAYIANVVKCRPPGNRTPTPEEGSACAAYLDRQIELVAPRLIVALGKTAAIRLLGTEASLGSLRGRAHDYKGTPLVVTYHPAYLLRSLPEKARAWEDLVFARRMLAGA